jgi:hypothetical protein
MRVLRPFAIGPGGDLPYRPHRSGESWRSRHGRQPRTRLRLLFAPQGRAADRSRPGKRRARPPLPSTARPVARPLPLAERAPAREHGNRPRNDRGSGDEPPFDPRHPRRGTRPRPTPGALKSPGRRSGAPARSPFRLAPPGRARGARGPGPRPRPEADPGCRCSRRCA